VSAVPGGAKGDALCRLRAPRPVLGLREELRLHGTNALIRMARTAKKGKTSGSGFSIFDEGEAPEPTEDEELPRDEAGRAKIKQQYVDLLGIRIKKKRGNILNRERINKTQEGVYFICARCEKVCHNLDEGLVEDEKNVNNICLPCSKVVQTPAKSSPGSGKGDSRREKSISGTKTKPKAKKSPGTLH